MSRSLEAYLKERSQLIAEDTSLRCDTNKLQNMTPAESKAEEIVRKIRKQENEQIWSHKNEDLLHPFPGMAFLTAKTTIESTKIYDLVKKMPKGALLHAHLEATVDAKTVLDMAIKHANICIRSSAVVTVDNYGSILPDFFPLATSSTYTSSPSITSPEYTPDIYVSAQKVRNEWPEALGGSSGFDSWVVKAMTINPEEAYGTHNTTVKIWDKFITCFSVLRGLLIYEPILKQFLQHLFQSCVDDGIAYAEFRMDFTPKTMIAEDGVGSLDHDNFFAIFQGALQAFQAKLRASGQSSLFHGAKVIYTIVRMITPEDLEWYLEDCLSLKQKYPDVLAAFDVVGPEDVTHPLIYYVNHLLAFREKCDSMGIDLPFLFHAGETLGDGNSVDQNLYDAILLGTKRIGHAFSLIKHPTLLRLCRERQICCEVCPVSNEILRLTSSMPAHPLPAMLNHGVPIALASDDPGIFNNIGLTYDFFQVLISSEITGLMTLGVIARQSLEFSLLDAESKARALRIWDERWKQFVDYVVSIGT